MFIVNDVFSPTEPLVEITGPVRLIWVVKLKEVVLIDISEANQAGPFRMPYRQWVDYLDSGQLIETEDPYQTLPSSLRANAPASVIARIKSVIAITSQLSRDSELFSSKDYLKQKLIGVAASTGLHEKTIKRWLYTWLKAGRNPAAVVQKFVQPRKGMPSPQSRGKKRGLPPRLEAAQVAAHEFEQNVKKAYDTYVVGRGMTWHEAYYETLISIYLVPASSISNTEEGLFLNPALMQKLKIPNWAQFRYQCRKHKKARDTQLEALPRGTRGAATDGIFGPGFFEIDATYFQIQLVSRLTKSKLVGRPVVYLVVDIFSDAIVGYAVTLENPSWASAALALYNCFSDKGDTFRRLALPFESKDWPSRQLPNVLRADRAELISNMGQEFPASGIRIEITPSMTPIAKGSVEGKHSQVKKERKSRFDLPGRFSKIRARRETDGKRAAALNILEFERILVEIILDLNQGPVNPRRIPPDAIPFGPKIASRIGFYEWGLEHRAGYTRQMGPHFVYEHLLTRGDGTVTSRGIRFKSEVFYCDRLQTLGYLVMASQNSFKIPVAYNPQLATEVYFLDPEKNVWIPAFNIDPEITKLKASFSEAQNYRATQEQLTNQAGLGSHGKRRTRTPVIRKTIKDAVAEKKTDGLKTSSSKAEIRKNRTKEKASERRSNHQGQEKVHPPGEASSAPNETPDSKANDTFESLWSEVDDVSK